MHVFVKGPKERVINYIWVILQSWTLEWEFAW